MNSTNLNPITRIARHLTRRRTGPSPMGRLLVTGLMAASFLSVSFSAHAQEADLSKVPSGAYAVDPTHAYIQFQYNHLGLSEPILSFDDFTIDMTLDVDDPTKTTVAVSIDTNSVLTGSDVFHEHITGEKWFDAAANPKIMFTSTGVSGSGDSFQVTGDLTIKGMTKPLTLDVKINAAMSHPMKKVPVIGVSATGALKRSEWELGANAPYISDEVKLQIQAELIQG